MTTMIDGDMVNNAGITLARRLMTTMIDGDMVNNAGIAQCYYLPTGESQEFNPMPKFLYAI